MAKGMKENNNINKQKIISDPKKNATESAKKIENNEENEVIIKALRKEIENLKKEVANQEETIDYLVQG